MKYEKFPKRAEIRIKYDEALERNLEKARNSRYETELKDPEVQDAIRLIQKKVGLLSLIDFWPKAEVFEIMDMEIKERVSEFVLENVVRYIFSEKIPEVIMKGDDGSIIYGDRIMTFCWEVDKDGWGCETGWLYFDFAVYNDENFKEVAFAGTFKTAIDVLHANKEELQTWLYSRDWEFKEKDIEELEKKYNEE